MPSQKLYLPNQSVTETSRTVKPHFNTDIWDLQHCSIVTRHEQNILQVTEVCLEEGVTIKLPDLYLEKKGAPHAA